jgi:hypothetical protein
MLTQAEEIRAEYPTSVPERNGPLKVPKKAFDQTLYFRRWQREVALVGLHVTSEQPLSSI